MSSRRLKVILEANIGQYESNLRKAKQSTDAMGKAATAAGRDTDRAGRQSEQASDQSASASEKAAQAHKKAEAAARERADAMKEVGGVVTAFGAATVAALGLAAKAAIEWESAWAGVNKTVDGTPKQMAALEGELRELAKTLPLTHTEIAAVAEAAGQLGIKRDDIAGFTKTMIDLGETTNLSAEEASTAIAQMMNVMQSAPGDVDNLGSALVALGNAGASTEKDIVNMAQRIAGAGKLIGASESDVLALSNTLASLGIRAEAGGSAASRVLLDLYTAVEDGGQNLTRFAEAAGMSAQEFATAFKKDPVGAMDAFTQGLNRIKGEGGNVIGTLKELGFTSTEDTRLLLALAGSGDMLTESLKLGNKAWKENTALVEEANKRYDTTEAKISVAWNNIKDAAIDAGAVILPVISEVADSVAELAEWFGNLPAPVQAALTGLTGLIGVTSLVGGGFLLMLPKIQDSRDALNKLGPAGARANTILGKVGRAAGIATVALAGLAIAGKISDQFVSENKSVEEFAQALLMAAEEGKDLQTVFANGDLFGSSNDFALTAGDIDSVGDAIARVNTESKFTQFRDWVNESFSGIASSEIVETKESLEAVDAAITSFAQSGAMDQAAESFQQVAAEAKAQGIELKTVGESFPQYLDHLRGLAQDAGVAVSEQELLNWAMGKTPPKMEAAAEKAERAAAGIEDVGLASGGSVPLTEEMTEALQDLGIAADGTIVNLEAFTEALFASGLAVMSSRQAQAQYQESLDGISDKVKEIADAGGKMGATLNKNASDFNLSSDAGRLANETFQGLAQDGMAQVEAMAREGVGQDQLQAKLEGTYGDLINTAGAFGITGQKAKNLAREVLGVPDGVSIKSWMDAQAKNMAEETTGAALDVPDNVNIDSWMSEAAKNMAEKTKGAANAIPNKETIDSWMSDSAFKEALKTRAAALNIPEKEAIDSFMSSAARGTADKTTAAILGIPKGASISAFMEAYARIEARNTQAAINAIDKSVYVSIVTEKTTILNTKQGTSYAPRNTGVGKGPLGFAGGGRLPLTGPGTGVTDGILGVSSLTGEPTAYVDKGEWVINGQSSNKYNRLLSAVNRDDPSIQHLAGLATGGRAKGLIANSGEENWQWGGRWEDFVGVMERSFGRIEDWVGFEDGSGWIRFFDQSMVHIEDGVWTLENSTTHASRSMDDAAANMGLAGTAANNTAGSFRVAGVSANGTAGTFNAAGRAAGGTVGDFREAGAAANGTAGSFNRASQLTQKAANAIVAATARVSAAGKVRSNAQPGGLIARPGEQNHQWQGRQMAFVNSINRTQGAVKEYSLHEDGSGQIVLEDGRRIQVREGRWQYVDKFQYGAPTIGRTPYRSTGGRLPKTGPGTNRTDGILGVSSMTGEPTSYVDAGEWVVNGRSSEVYNRELAAINAGTFPKLPGYADGSRVGRQQAVTNVYAAPSASGGAVTATLAPEDRTLLRAVAERGFSVQIGNKVVAEANIVGRKQLRLPN